jgi:hypothetical protein
MDNNRDIVDMNILFPINIKVLRRQFCAAKDDLINERLLCSASVRPAQPEN